VYVLWSFGKTKIQRIEAIQMDFTERLFFFLPEIPADLLLFNNEPKLIITSFIFYS
jgi:hypothetical protein